MRLTSFEIQDFKRALGISEGSGNYTAVYPKTGQPKTAFGLYQFTRPRLKEVAAALGEVPPDPAAFLADPAMQEKYFAKHLNMILAAIEDNNLTRFIGLEISGANKWPRKNKINIFGLIAGAHLGGDTGLNTFLTTGYDAKDANGTYISDYISKFSELTEKKKVINNFDIIAGLGALVLTFIIMKEI